MTRMYCQKCKAFTEHTHFEATAESLKNVWVCDVCGFRIEVYLNKWAATRLRKEKVKQK